MGVTKIREKVEREPKEKKPTKVEKPKVEIKEIRRVAGTDLDGTKSLVRALRKIKGISHAFSKAICTISGFNPNTKLGSLTEQDIQKIEEIIKDPIKFGMPIWLVNRRRDLETGKDIHLTGSDLEIARKFDVKRMIDLKTYRGFRHMLGQPVRGQRTRAHFRGGRVVGVLRKEAKAMLMKKEEEKK